MLLDSSPSRSEHGVRMQRPHSVSPVLAMCSFSGNNLFETGTDHYITIISPVLGRYMNRIQLLFVEGRRSVEVK